MYILMINFNQKDSRTYGVCSRFWLFFLFTLFNVLDNTVCRRKTFNNKRKSIL